MTKLLSIVGARPQFVKCAAVSRKIRQIFSEVLVHTGQHYDEKMSQVFFDELSIPPPDYNLAVGSGMHGSQTGEMLKGIEALIVKEQPHGVLVYGDTNSTLAGALAAVKLHIPVFHVEAGLRSFNRRMPEEINRVITDHISSLLFCPTQTAMLNLTKEGITNGVSIVGDVMEDALLLGLAIAETRSTMFDKLNLKVGEYFLATVHRAENTDSPDRMNGILAGFAKLAAMGRPVIFPAHPRTRRILNDMVPESSAAIRFIEPLSFCDMLIIEKNARGILTDSGGVQKEAAWLGVPCVTLREETEWVETVASGWNYLAGFDPKKIVQASLRARPENNPHELVGGATDRIASKMVDFFKALGK